MFGKRFFWFLGFFLCLAPKAWGEDDKIVDIQDYITKSVSLAAQKSFKFFGRVPSYLADYVSGYNGTYDFYIKDEMDQISRVRALSSQELPSDAGFYIIFEQLQEEPFRKLRAYFSHESLGGHPNPSPNGSVLFFPFNESSNLFLKKRGSSNRKKMSQDDLLKKHHIDMNDSYRISEVINGLWDEFAHIRPLTARGGPWAKILEILYEAHGKEWKNIEGDISIEVFWKELWFLDPIWILLKNRTDPAIVLKSEINPKLTETDIEESLLIKGEPLLIKGEPLLKIFDKAYRLFPKWKSSTAPSKISNSTSR